MWFFRRTIANASHPRAVESEATAINDLVDLIRVRELEHKDIIETLICKAQRFSQLTCDLFEVNENDLPDCIRLTRSWAEMIAKPDQDSNPVLLMLTRSICQSASYLKKQRILPSFKQYAKTMDQLAQTVEAYLKEQKAAQHSSILRQIGTIV